MSDLAPEEQSIDTIPRGKDFNGIYQQMLDLAGEHLNEPVTATIDTWEDGTFRVRVFHHIPASNEREVLYYHSEEGVIRYGVESDDELKSERVVSTNEPVMGSS